jgi:hypothetical protein
LKLDLDIAAFKLEDLVQKEINAATQEILIQRQIDLSSSSNQCSAWKIKRKFRERFLVSTRGSRLRNTFSLQMFVYSIKEIIQNLLFSLHRIPRTETTLKIRWLRVRDHVDCRQYD